MKDPETFDAAMFDMQLEISKVYAKEVGELRVENKALRKRIDEFPSDMTELQDRVSMLEARLAHSTTGKVTP